MRSIGICEGIADTGACREVYGLADIFICVNPFFHQNKKSAEEAYLCRNLFAGARM